MIRSRAFVTFSGLGNWNLEILINIGLQSSRRTLARLLPKSVFSGRSWEWGQLSRSDTGRWGTWLANGGRPRRFAWRRSCLAWDRRKCWRRPAISQSGQWLRVGLLQRSLKTWFYCWGSRPKTFLEIHKIAARDTLRLENRKLVTKYRLNLFANATSIDFH